MVKTSVGIKNDTAALSQLRDYMEYTKIVSENNRESGILNISQSKETQNNTYVQNLTTYGEAKADERLRRQVSGISINGERIKKFVL